MEQEGHAAVDELRVGLVRSGGESPEQLREVVESVAELQALDVLDAFEVPVPAEGLRGGGEVSAVIVRQGEHPPVAQ